MNAHPPLCCQTISCFYYVLTLLTGVAQVLNRLDGKPFDDADQRLFEVSFLTLLQCRGCVEGLLPVVNSVCLLVSSQAFVIFCGLGINNTIMYDQVKKSWAKQSVALDVRARNPISNFLSACISTNAAVQALILLPGVGLS